MAIDPYLKYPQSTSPLTFQDDGDYFTEHTATKFVPQANALAVDVNAKSVIATQQAALATTNGATQVALATEQAELATTNGQTQVALAAQQADLATTNGATQVNLAAQQVSLASAQVTLAAQQATTATTQASIASSMSNFKGIWSNLTGALNVPASVYLDGITYRLLVNVANVTLSNPSTDVTKWSVIDGVVPTAVVGDINSPIYDLPLRNSLTPLVGVGAVTFSRAGTATHINRYGKVVDLAAGIPGHDADGIDLPCASSNVLLYSEEFDNAYWTKTYLTVTPNVTIAPNGLTTMDKLVEDATNNPKFLIKNPFSIIAGSPYTSSVFAKAAERSQILLLVGDGVTNYSRLFDLSTGLAIDIAVAETTLATQYGIENLGNGIYRCWIGMTAAGTAGQLQYRVYKDSSGIYTGDGTSGLYLWGVQLEALPFPTPYIKTLASPVSRLGASLSFPYADNMPGLLYSKTVTFDVDVIGSTVAGASAFHSGDVQMRISRSVGNDKGLQLVIGAAGTSTTIIKDGKFKFSMTYDAATSVGSLYIDNIKIATMTRTTTAAAFENILINAYSVSYVKMKNLKIYDKCFTPEQMRLI